MWHPVAVVLVAMATSGALPWAAEGAHSSAQQGQFEVEDSDSDLDQDTNERLRLSQGGLSLGGPGPAWPYVAASFPGW